MVNIIREYFPSLKDRVPEGNPAQALPSGVYPTGWDMRISQEILANGSPDGKWEYIDLKRSVVDAVNSILSTGILN